MQVHELALQRNKYKHLTDDEWRWLLQQVEGRERTADKLPTFAAIPDWWYPVRLSCEQCSSELTARYKASLANGEKMVDLTAGYGVDTYFLSERFERSDYVEQNEELCRIATHNFANKPISIHNTTAEEFLQTAGQYDLIYLDPARRDSHGGKVFRLEDCTPNVVELLPTLLSHLTPDGRLMLKLSPMLDITQALTTLAVSHWPLAWNVHVVAVKNEVKEVLLLGQQPTANSQQPTITCIDLAEPEKAFCFTREEERDCLLMNGDASLNGAFLYEPNAAILKAGAYKLVAQRFGLQKLDINTHLYASDTLVPDFPGRVWQIANSQQPKANSQANVVCRNYPLTPEQLKKKMRLKDGGEDYLIGARVNGKPTLFWAQRVEKS
ncbi:MAG: SAM-dependent methyltransferase [Paludibacteraceae bacterium]|nr:SAM-dependent methyltransferase [Paludibacteraceae bacterium]